VRVLKGVVEAPRRHEAHITLMPPRNSTCTDAIFDEIKALDLPRELVFGRIYLIEQESEHVWKVLQEVELNDTGA